MPGRRIDFRHPAVLVLFFTSGACGLIYEVIWSRQLGLIFGNTVQSLSAVLTAFMGGLALGSFLGGRFCDRLKRPLMAYGILELLIGLYCAFLPMLLSHTGPIVPLYRALYSEDGSWMLSVARFSISFVLLLIPSMFMGATLPVLSKYLVRAGNTLGGTVGILYAVNTFGAVAGAAGAGFYLLPVFGKASTNWLAVGGNVLLGLIGIALGRNELPPEPVVSEPEKAPVADASTSSTLAPVSQKAVTAAVVTFGITGFAAMAVQIGWTRAISLAMGSSTYAFSLIVSIYILGLALGGAWGARISSRTPDPVALLAKVLIWIGVLGMAVSALLGYGPVFFFFLLAWGAQWDWSTLLMLEAAGIAMLIIVPTFLMGATMPLTLQVASRFSTSAGKTVGNIYSANTAGSILGSLLGGLVLLPAFSVRTTLDAMSLCYALPGIALFVLSASGRKTAALGRVALPVTALVLITNLAPVWDPAILSSGAYLLRDNERVAAARLWRLKEAYPSSKDGREIVYYEEGAAATVSVEKTAGLLTLKVGGKPDASSGEDMNTQVMLALLPEILHAGETKDVLVIGLGSGVSAGCATAATSVRQADVVEMLPGVVRASWFFRERSGLTYTEPEHWLETPRLRLIVNDGRNHLLLTGNTYDVITSEPSNPWMAGIGNLFTRENFELCRARLKPNGVMCQWVQNYSLEEGDFLSIVRTFSDVFKHVSLWNVGADDYMLIGTEAPLKFSPLAMREHLAANPRAKSFLEAVHLDRPADFLGSFVASDENLRKLSARFPIHSDDNMNLEFSAPRALYNPRQLFRSTVFLGVPDGIIEMDKIPEAERAAFMQSVDLAVSAHEHMRYDEIGLGSRAGHVQAALAIDPYQKTAIEYKNHEDAAVSQRMLDGTGGTPNAAAALSLLEKSRDRSVPHIEYPRKALDAARASRAAQLAGSGDLPGAMKLAAEMESQPEKAALLQAQFLVQIRNYADALDQLKRASGLGASQWACAEVALSIFNAQGNKEAIVGTLNNMLSQPSAKMDREASKLWHMRALIELKENRLDSAASDCDAALHLSPLFPAYVQTRALIFQQQGRWPDAITYSRAQSALQPVNLDARMQLSKMLFAAAAHEAGSNKAGAIELLRCARRNSLEVCTVGPERAEAWTSLAGIFAALAEIDTENSVLCRQEEARCNLKAQELRK